MRMTQKLRRSRKATEPVRSDAAWAVYERIRAACCLYHGFPDDRELELHARMVALAVIDARGRDG
jgi:hypothetical protein